MKLIHLFLVGVLLIESLVFAASPAEHYTLDLSQPLKVPSLVIPIRPTSDLDGMSVSDLKALGFKFYQVSQPAKRRVQRAHRPSAAISSPYRERAQLRAWAGMLPTKPTFNSLTPTTVNPLLARVAALRAEAPVETESEATLDEAALLPVAHAGGNLSMGEFVRRGEIAATGAHVLMATCNPTSGSLSAIQTCVNSAVRGDNVDVPVANNSGSSGLTLPTKSGSFNGSNYITIRSASHASLPSARVNNTTDVANMPTITVTGSGQSALVFNSGSTGYKIDGLHITNNLTISSSADYTSSFIFIPSDSTDNYFDRLVVHPKESPSVANDYLGSAAYAFNVQGDRITVARSYMYDFAGRDGTAYKLKGIVAAETITGITTANPTVISYDGSPAVATGDTIRVVLGLNGRFEPGCFVSEVGCTAGSPDENARNDWPATAINGTSFSLPIDLSAGDTFNATYSRAMFFKWPRVSSVTLGNPTTFTMAVAHNLATGDKVRPRGFLSTLGAAINGNDYTVTVTGSTTFTIPVNTTSLSSYSGAGGYYKSEASAMQTIIFGVGPDVQDFTAINNFVGGWYSGMQTAAADASPSITTTVTSVPAPAISSITLGSPTTIVMSAAHGLSTGWSVMPYGMTSTLGTALNNIARAITVTNSTTFTIAVDTTSLSSYSGSGGFLKPTHLVLADTTGISAGMLIAMDTTHSDIKANCPFGGQGGDRPCFGFAPVGSVDSGTDTVYFKYPIKVKNGDGELVDPFSAILSPGQVNVTGQNPTRIHLYYNTIEVPFDFTAFHLAANGNTSKGFIEGKDCTDCEVVANIIQGFPSSFAHTVANQNGSSPWMGLFNILIENNWFKSFYVGSLNSFTDYNARNTQGYGLTVNNNLFLSGVGFSGECFRFSQPASDVVYTHNTCVNGYPATATGTTYVATKPGATNPYYPVNDATGVIIRDNLTDAGLYVAACYNEAGAGVSFASACFNADRILQYNGFAKTVSSSDPLFIFTHATNKVVASWAAVKFVGSDPDVLTDWALAADSPFKGQGSGGSDMGVNIAALAAALANNDGFTQGGGGATTTRGVRGKGSVKGKVVIR